MEQLTELEQMRFGGIARLYGQKALINFKNSTVMVIGLGGVGTWVVESLARSGVGHLILVDLDEVCITNTNRQLIASENTIGQSKAHLLKSRIHQINSDAKVEVIDAFYTEKTAEEILNYKPDLIIDAIDSADTKCHLIARASEREIPIIVTGGAAGKMDPTKVQIADLAFTFNDTLLQMIRKKLRRDYGFKRPKKSSLSGRLKLGITAIFSPEDPVFPTSSGGVCITPEADSIQHLDCQTGMGSVTHLTGIFGFMAASVALKMLENKNQY